MPRKSATKPHIESNTDTQKQKNVAKKSPKQHIEKIKDSQSTQMKDSTSPLSAPISTNTPANTRKATRHYARIKRRAK
ncbi:MAG TPA: hypothetical protein DEQ48_05565, partial [Helicobacter sp.]|nr:hypothetical protein [Helicobacter sp.]